MGKHAGRRRNFDICNKGARQKLLSGFYPLRGRGVYPPFLLSFFEHNDCPLRGGGVPPKSAKENSAKKQFFVGPKTKFFVFFFIQ